MTSRPHCEAPEACVAKGPRHCRRCAGLRAMATLRSDPAFVDRLNDTARHLSAEGRSKMAANLKRLNQDPAFAAKRDAKARRLVAAFSANPAIIKMRTSKAVTSKATRLGRRLNIPLQLVDDFRELRARGFSEPRALTQLARANPEAFRARREAEIAKHRRVIDRRVFGPVPMGEPPAGRSALAQRQAEQAANQAGRA